jgi:rRNA-processing protein FCF1
MTPRNLQTLLMAFLFVAIGALVTQCAVTEINHIAEGLKASGLVTKEGR